MGPCAPSNRMWGRSSSMRFQQPRYWVRTSDAFCSGVLVKNALLRWVGGHEGMAQMSSSALLSADDSVVLRAAAPAGEGIPAACKSHVLCPCSRAAGRNRQGASASDKEVVRLAGCASTSRAVCSPSRAHKQARRQSGCAAPMRRHWRHTSCAVASAVMGSRSKMWSSSSSGSSCSIRDSSACRAQRQAPGGRVL